MSFPLRRYLSFLSGLVCLCAWGLSARGDVPDVVPEQASRGNVGGVLPSLRQALVCHFDFDHPDGARADREIDQGPSGAFLNLVNGGAEMRMKDEAWRGSGHALQTMQTDPESDGNDDWKAGCFEPGGMASMERFGGAGGITLMGWFKVTGPVPAPNSVTPRVGDLYAGAGLVGVLTGDSDGHFCRALIEILRVDGEMRVVALGRRVDGGATQMGVWESPLAEVLPEGQWTHLAAVFDYEAGIIRVYRNGRLAPMRHYQPGNPWAGGAGSGRDKTSETRAAGLKVGGSYPQNQKERNPFNGRMDDLMAFDRALTTAEVEAQFAQFGGIGNGN